MANAARKATFDRSTQHRRAMLGKINIARHQLKMDEDDYRQVLFDVAGARSLKEMDEKALDAVLARMKALGFQPLPKAGQKGAQHPVAKKARALWISLYHLGEVHNPSELALEAFAKRQLGCERLVWARQSDGFRLIEALKAMAERAGWRQNCPVSGKKLAPSTLQQHLCELIVAKLKSAGAIPQDWSLDTAAYRLCGIETRETERGYSAEDYHRLASALGAKLREVAPHHDRSGR
ncbi:gp16 family protein [Aurantiacibacter xanthus]|nr:regulatory protein GemA [Aurantiacibacter xanthus]